MIPLICLLGSLYYDAAEDAFKAETKGISKCTDPDHKNFEREMRRYGY